MPRRIFPLRIVRSMQPYQLIAALMHAQKLKTNALASSMRKPALQPTLHRFLDGKVKEPARSTAEPLATYFGIPVEAIYNQIEATKIASARGLTVVDWPPKQARRSKDAVHAIQGDKIGAAVQAMALLSPDERRAVLERYSASIPKPGKRDPKRA